MKFSISQEQKKQLINEALQARKFSYSPYSHFAVGCSLLMEDGSIVTGTNVENLSYGLSVCAERNAVGTAVGKGKRRIVAACVSTASQVPSAPCGACRQVLAEFSDHLSLLLINEEGEVLEMSLDDIFSSQFSKEQLESGTQK